MSDYTQKLRQLISGAETLSADSLSQLIRHYPYFPLPAMTLITDHSQSLPEEEISRLQFHLALICGDKQALFTKLSEQGKNLAALYPPSLPPPSPTTDNAIDTFFANYGSADPAETELIERLIFNPTPDYAEILLQDHSHEEAHELEAGSMENKIDAFVRTHSPVINDKRRTDSDTNIVQIGEATKKSKPRPSTAAEDSLLSESLAKIFIKQGRYERAYEIISNLSLNYPKKSIYFADQLRFLQKLIKIQEAQKANDKIKNQ